MSDEVNVTALILSGFNQTLLENPYLCTVDTCPLTFAPIHYVPSLAGNALYLVIFALCLIAQLYFTYRYRTWSFSGAMFGGLVLEILGYVSRVQMHGNPFKGDYFLMFVISLSHPFTSRSRISKLTWKVNRYLVVLTIAPCFFAAAIYLSLSRLIIIYGESFARFKPRVYTIIFICCDVFSLVLQAAGGAIADTGGDEDTVQTGINIMISGLAFQVASLTAFSALCLDFVLSVRRNGGISGHELQSRLRHSTPRPLKMFITGMLSLIFLIQLEMYLLKSGINRSHHRNLHNLHPLHLPSR